MSLRPRGVIVAARLLLALASLVPCAAVLPAALEPATALAAPAGEIAAVCDREIAPYRALLEGFQKAAGAPVRVIPPEEAGKPGLEQRLRVQGVRAILAVGIQAREAVEAVQDLPVLLAMVPQTDRWVAARPNRSGIEMALSPRQHLETMRRVFPAARRIGLLFDPAQTAGYVREAERTAADLGMTLVALDVARPGELSRKLDELRGRIDVLWLLPDPTVLQGANLDILLLASFESRIPLYGFAKKYAELGAIAASHLDPAAMGAQAAQLLHRLPAPAAIPPSSRWEYARGARLVLNQRVARKMGVVLDPALLEGADDVLR